jgi:CRP-like cAMP-binding protein
VPAFRGAPVEFLMQLASYLQPEYYSKGDIVVLQGDPGTAMYFVGEGKLEVRLGLSGLLAMV